MGRLLIKGGKYFLPPPSDGEDFKQLFRKMTAVGVGLPVDKDGFPTGQWTAERLTAAISQIDANPAGVELRTVQHWFEDNDRGIGTDNIRWLARIFGCGDPDATREWQAALSAANNRLSEKRRGARYRSQGPPPVVVQPETTDDLTNLVFASDRQFNLAKRTEALFHNHSSLSLPIVVFTTAAALGLIAFTLNIHSVMSLPADGPPKQVGFLWAPNWTIVFIIVLPMYLGILVNLLKRWKEDWRDRLTAAPGAPSNVTTWENRVAAASSSYWAALFITVAVASGFNWIVTYLLPLIDGDTDGWPIDWGRIAIYRPEVISMPAAVIFTGLVFIFNALCAYLFFSGLIFINVIAHDYQAVVMRSSGTVEGRGSRGIEQITLALVKGIFRCTSLGLIITILMKLQSGFLQSDSSSIVVWLIDDLQSLSRAGNLLASGNDNQRSAPGSYYSFFCVLAICGTYLNASIRIRLALIASKTATFHPISWLILNTSILLLVISYLAIGIVNGFSGFLILTLILAIYLVLRPDIRSDNSPQQG